MPNTQIVVAGGVDAGFQTIVMRTPDEMHVDSLFLLPSFQNNGIGTALLRARINEAWAKSVALSICVLRTNQGARRLYERLGFVVVWSDEIRVCMLLQRGDEGLRAPRR